MTKYSSLQVINKSIFLTYECSSMLIKMIVSYNKRITYFHYFFFVLNKYLFLMNQ